MAKTGQGGEGEEPGNGQPRVTETEVRYRQALNRREIYSAVGQAIRYASGGLAVGIIVQMSTGLVGLLAGRETVLTVDVSVGLTLSAGLGAATGYLLRVASRQRRQIVALRGRVEELENTLRQLDGLPDEDEEGPDEGEQP